MVTPPRRRVALLAGTLLACGPAPTGGGDPVPPVVAIVSPVPSATFAGGDQFEVRVAAHQPGAGALPPEAIETWVVLHHGTHTHPFLPVAPGATASLTIPRTGHFESDVFYRVHARATNTMGLADTVAVDLHPRLVDVTFTTVPAGLEVTVDNQPHPTPLTITSVQGMERAIGAPGPQMLGTLAYEFAGWQHGGAAQQTIVTPTEPGAFIARFAEAGVANLPPTVALTAPLPGPPLVVGVATTLLATSADLDGSVTRVEFFVGGVKIGEAQAAPFQLSWTPTAPGLRVITARATDDRGAYTLSAPVTVTVQAAGGGDVLAPVATLVSPAAGTRDLTGSVPLQAAATDDVGVTEVEFDLDGIVIATVTTPPYVATLPATGDYTAGAHLLRARARDAAGNWSDWSVSPVTFAGTASLPAGLRQAVHVTGFTGLLTAIAVAPDGRIFVTEQGGRLRVIRNGQLLARPFVTLPVDPFGERGLLGVALHPDFAVNHLLYLYYTTPDGGTHNRISRFVASSDTALAAGEMTLVDLPPLNSVPKHNGGAMAFGADGKLYVAVGDNTDAALAPSLESPFGKMLRFNADGSIPADNPFLTQTTGINRAIWARGLRNPFTFAIQPGTGRMHINDVGASAWEEINLGRAGADYGWPFTEGHTGDPRFDTPLLSYGHAGGSTLFTGGAVVGAAFYHPVVPILGTPYLGSYFFADYVDGWIYRLPAADPTAAVAFAHTGGNPTGLAVGPDGALYVLMGTRIDRIGP